MLLHPCQHLLSFIFDESHSDLGEVTSHCVVFFLVTGDVEDSLMAIYVLSLEDCLQFSCLCVNGMDCCLALESFEFLMYSIHQSL